MVNVFFFFFFQSKRQTDGQTNTKANRKQTDIQPGQKNCIPQSIDAGV